MYTFVYKGGIRFAYVDFYLYLCVMKKSIIIVFVVLCIVVSSSVDSHSVVNDRWEAPSSADTLKNPYTNSAETFIVGKKLFKQMCAICHGNRGRGNGIGGIGLPTKPTNLTSKVIQGQTDGAIFWKISEGRIPISPMAPYKSILKEDQRWGLVNYIRTL